MNCLPETVPINHGVLENEPLTSVFSMKTPPFSLGIFQPVMFDETRGYHSNLPFTVRNSSLTIVTQLYLQCTIAICHAYWWFGTCFIFAIYWECHLPNWLSYFSECLKPPTRVFSCYTLWKLNITMENHHF